MPTISFKPKKVTKRITSRLQDRASDVIMNRFGLTADGKRKTLEEIGKKYNITRERVRQVEEAAINLIKKSELFYLARNYYKSVISYIVIKTVFNIYLYAGYFHFKLRMMP